uniref:Potassium channel domain-containing protein n=1 Tax=Amphora coffeiformis TaxID=265554 RepID=A0A7S3L9A2_9STRA
MAEESSDLLNNHPKDPGKHKKPFFGVPVVGFFREKQPPKRRREEDFEDDDDEPVPNITASKRGVTFQLDSLSASSSSEEEDEFDEERGVSNFRRYGSFGSGGSSSMGKRTGKELWAIVRRHVFHKDFHIRDTVRMGQRSLFQSIGPGSTASKSPDVRFRDIDLPYDFTLVDCFLALLAYLVISVIAFSFVFEQWSIIDSMYFAVVTFTTIGYGDFSPSTTGGRLFCVLFALGGVAVLAIALGVVGHKIVETQVSSITKAEAKFVDDMAKTFQKKLTASQRQKAYAKRSSSGGSGSSFSYLNEVDQIGYSIRRRAKAIKSPWHSTWDWMKKFAKMLGTYVPALTPLFLGAFYIGHFEKWNWSDVIYYCVVTTTSIGYGDLTPIREDTRLFAVIYIPLAVGAMGHFLGTIATFIVEQRTQKTNEILWKHELTIDDLRSMSSSDGTVTELDFVVFMLKAMKKVDDDLIDAIREHFVKLDLTHSGTLGRKDLELRAQQQLQSVKTKLRLATYKAELLRKCSVSTS